MRPQPHPEAQSATVPVDPKAVLPAAPAPAEVPAAPAPARPDAPVASSPFAPKPPKPIGPEALKALREAIRSGKYPSDDAVRAGLERLIRRPE